MVGKTHTDLLDQKVYYYCYDSIGRLIRQDVTDLSGEFVSSTEYTYDVMNNVIGVKTEAGGRVFTQEYSYSEVEDLPNTVSYAKDNLPTRYVISAGNYLDYRYDTLNRMYGKTLSIGSSSLYYNYIYKLSNRNENGDNLVYLLLNGAILDIGCAIDSAFGFVVEFIVFWMRRRRR